MRSKRQVRKAKCMPVAICSLCSSAKYAAFHAPNCAGLVWHEICVMEREQSYSTGTRTLCARTSTRSSCSRSESSPFSLSIASRIFSTPRSACLCNRLIASSGTFKKIAMICIFSFSTCASSASRQRCSEEVVILKFSRERNSRGANKLLRYHS